MSLLELKNISKSYLSKLGNFQVINKLNLSVGHNENANLVIDLILKISKKFNLSTIIASHDISFRPLFDLSLIHI